ncbi:unknown protein [Seminavis robusta]|uniref:DUF7495 domain-containing protein n=1 Tax=Seminavis robusta TaxID=568900 RepID=A0A9N8HXL9_9STRA|nr:unknown protein [Seminavis robusta]|eukprot:Sro1831_g300360.1 n/a (185) ;mRNA; f:8216-8770
MKFIFSTALMLAWSSLPSSNAQSCYSTSWQDRGTGDQGQGLLRMNWQQRKDSCEGQGLRLCTYDELCPGGAGMDALGLPAQNVGDMWVAVSDSFWCSSNAFVQLGDHPAANAQPEKCWTHDAVAGFCPSWGTRVTFDLVEFHQWNVCCEDTTCPTSTSAGGGGDPHFKVSHGNLVVPSMRYCSC